jgi:two-component system, OmpR family, phosphate regulon response regulator PhoB
VVILDLMLPDMSGTEVCRRLRADPELGDVAILMLTARGDEFDKVLSS